MIEQRVMPAREFRRQAWVSGSHGFMQLRTTIVFFQNLMHLDDDSRLELP